MAYITEYTDLHPKEKRQLFYKRQWKEEHPAWDDTMVFLRNALEARLGTGLSVLDAGCGHGNYIIDELRGKFARAVGIDVSREATTRNVCLDEVVIGNLEHLPFPDNQFDLVVSLWVLEHVAEPAKVFQEIYRVLKPGGRFVFATPNKKSWLIYARRSMNYGLAKRLVRRLYGRAEEDVFPIQYRANTGEDIQKVAAAVGFHVELLEENTDPSYTSFGRVSYRLSAWLSQTGWSLFRPHLVGILKK